MGDEMRDRERFWRHMALCAAINRNPSPPQEPDPSQADEAPAAASAGGGDDEPELCPCGKGTSCLGCDSAPPPTERRGDE